MQERIFKEKVFFLIKFSTCCEGEIVDESFTRIVGVESEEEIVEISKSMIGEEVGAREYLSEIKEIKKLLPQEVEKNLLNSTQGAVPVFVMDHIREEKKNINSEKALIFY